MYEKDKDPHHSRGPSITVLMTVMMTANASAAPFPCASPFQEQGSADICMYVCTSICIYIYIYVFVSRVSTKNTETPCGPRHEAPIVFFDQAPFFWVRVSTKRILTFPGVVLKRSSKTRSHCSRDQPVGRSFYASSCLGRQETHV